MGWALAIICAAVTGQIGAGTEGQVPVVIALDTGKVVKVDRENLTFVEADLKAGVFFCVNPSSIQAYDITGTCYGEVPLDDKTLGGPVVCLLPAGDRKCVYGYVWDLEEALKGGTLDDDQEPTPLWRFDFETGRSSLCDDWTAVGLDRLIIADGHLFHADVPAVDEIAGISLSPDIKYLYGFALETHHCNVYDVTAKRLVRGLGDHHVEGAWAPDSRRLAVGRFGGDVKIFDIGDEASDITFTLKGVEDDKGYRHAASVLRWSPSGASVFVVARERLFHCIGASTECSPVAENVVDVFPIDDQRALVLQEDGEGCRLSRIEGGVVEGAVLYAGIMPFRTFYFPAQQKALLW